MNRRDLLSSALTAASLTLAEAPARTAAAPSGSIPSGMVAGHQHDHSDETLRLLAALGVTHICSGLPSPRFDENWTVEGLTRLRSKVEGYGIRLLAVPLPMSSRPIDTAEFPHILLGKDPERDQEIEWICAMIRNAAAAGIPMLKYNLTLLGVPRTGRAVGRGGAAYSEFIYRKADVDQPLKSTGSVSEDEVWERISYFLKRVVPVAEKAGVRLALHPNDPGLPQDRPFRGVHAPLASIAGLKRFVDLVDSPAHGLNFCQGTVSEMLERPGEQIYDVIRYFGKRGKIFNVHFRNIEGGLLNFRETFPDNGDVDMLRALRTYREVGYRGMIMPDHVPVIQGDTGGKNAFSFCFGYIQALLRVVNQSG